MLTEFEKEKIELMREFGLRYDEIAKRLGVTKNQVRYYCKKIGCLLRVDEMPNKRCAYCRNIMKNFMKSLKKQRQLKRIRSAKKLMQKSMSTLIRM